MLLATSNRNAMIVGYAVAALFRALLVWTVVTVVALLSGAELLGSGIDLFGIALIAILMNVAALLFACGMAMRLRTMQAAPLIQLPAFLLIMTAPVYVPRELIEGWVSTVADFNPMTAVLEAGRNLVIGAPAETFLALGVAAGLIAADGDLGLDRPAPSRSRGLGIAAGRGTFSVRGRSWPARMAGRSTAIGYAHRRSRPFSRCQCGARPIEWFGRNRPSGSTLALISRSRARTSAP